MSLAEGSAEGQLPSANLHSHMTMVNISLNEKKLEGSPLCLRTGMPISPLLSGVAPSFRAVRQEKGMERGAHHNRGKAVYNCRCHDDGIEVNTKASPQNY